MNRLVVCAILMGGIVASSCKKDGFYAKSDAALEFSEKTIAFDTVFTCVSTITRVLRVKNPYRSNIKTDITLVGGTASYFSLNIDGVPARQLKDVEIPAQDSIFIFIKANINPNGVNNPMLACDTIAFTTNGNRQNVELLAYGQDAHFITPNDTLFMVYEDGSMVLYHCNFVAIDGKEVTWKNDKPYVIYGYAFVGQDAKLTIEKGTRVYVHKGGMLWVWNGCLEVNGTKDEPVTFQGDRLDKWYDKDYNQWDRIWICESGKDSKINYAVIQNAYIGIQAETIGEKKNNKLLLTNTIIKRSQKAGLLAKDYTIEASNNVFIEAMEHCVALVQGGDYTFTNNTLYNRYVNRRTTSSLYISNYYEYYDEKGKIFPVSNDFSGVFINNIIADVISRGFGFPRDYDKDKAFSVTFENCLIQMDSTRLESPVTHTNTIFNKDPEFGNVEDYKDLSLKSSSPCKNAGKAVSWLLTDIEGNSRNASYPSIGAYE